MVAGMVMPLVDLRTIYELLFRGGVMVAKKDKRPQCMHPEIQGVANLKVIRAMGSLKSKGFVRETFAWKHSYWYLTNEGIVYLRDYLRLPPEIMPSSLQRMRRTASTVDVMRRSAHGGVQTVKSPTSYVPKPRVRQESQEGMMDRQGYRHKRVPHGEEEASGERPAMRFRGSYQGCGAGEEPGAETQTFFRRGQGFHREEQRVPDERRGFAPRGPAYLPPEARVVRSPAPARDVKPFVPVVPVPTSIEPAFIPTVKLAPAPEVEEVVKEVAVEAPMPVEEAEPEEEEVIPDVWEQEEPKPAVEEIKEATEEAPAKPEVVEVVEAIKEEVEDVVEKLTATEVVVVEEAAATEAALVKDVPEVPAEEYDADIKILEEPKEVVDEPSTHEKPEAFSYEASSDSEASEPGPITAAVAVEAESEPVTITETIEAESEQVTTTEAIKEVEASITLPKDESPEPDLPTPPPPVTEDFTDLTEYHQQTVVEHITQEIPAMATFKSEMPLEVTSQVVTSTVTSTVFSTVVEKETQISQSEAFMQPPSIRMAGIVSQLGLEQEASALFGAECTAPVIPLECPIAPLECPIAALKSSLPQGDWAFLTEEPEEEEEEEEEEEVKI
ncbi:unnamed protein product [Coregonus sp. 'balchen']|nr:unnamed protein product [Coregonus sp. 'balchen']